MNMKLKLAQQIFNKYYAQHRVQLIAAASAHHENSFGISSGKYLFTKLVAEPRN